MTHTQAQTQNLPAQVDRRSLRQLIEKQAPEFGKNLPGHVPLDRFVRTIQTAVQMNPQVARAATASEGGRESFFAACTNAAKDGLILDGREAALVTFRQKVSGRNERERYEDRVQYIPMVAGLLKKARNSGQISSIAAHVVYERDVFTYVLGDDEHIKHEPPFGERGEPIAVYAIARLKDGSVQREVMDRAAVMRIAAQSKNPDQYDPKKGKNYGEWWRKTVIRRISKYLPSSSDRDEFLQTVERIDEGFDFESSDGGETIPVAPSPTKKRGGAAAALKDVTPKPQPKQEPDDYGPEPADYGDAYDPETGEIIDNDEFAQMATDDI